MAQINSVSEIVFVQGLGLTDTQLATAINNKITEVKASGKTVISVSISTTSPVLGAFLVIGNLV